MAKGDNIYHAKAVNTILNREIYMNKQSDDFQQTFLDLQSVGKDNDFIRKHDLEELVGRLKKLISNVEEVRTHPIIISLSNEKGGCGKTTISCIIAQLFTNLGFKTALFDLDSAKGSFDIMKNRKETIAQELTALKEYVENGEYTNEQALEYKNTELEPIVSHYEAVENKTLTPNSLFDAIIASKSDIVIIDSAGRKDLQSNNFNVNSLHDFNKPNHVTAYLSDLILIPSSKSSNDVHTSLGYIFPLKDFLIKLKGYKRNLRGTNTQVLFVPNKAGVKPSSVTLKQYEELLAGIDLNIAKSELPISDKIVNMVSVKAGSKTVFTHKTKTLTAIFNLATEIVSELEASIPL